jgi:hypothetical protein
MGCLNERVEEDGIVVLSGENTGEVDGVTIAELGDVVPEEAGDDVVSTRGETRAAEAESMWGTV